MARELGTAGNGNGGQRPAAGAESIGLERALLNAAPEAFAAVDAHGTIVFANREFGSMLGQRSEELLGQSIENVLPERFGEHHPAPHEAFYTVAAEMHSPRCDTNRTGRRRDGSEFAVQITSSAVATERGPLVALIVRDASERKRDEDSLRRRENEVRALIDGIRDYAIFRLDPDGRVVSWNAGAERIDGWKSEEIVGRHYSRLFPREDVAAGRPQYELREALRSGCFETEGWHLRKDGTRFWANGVMTPLRGAAGELLGFAKITRDMTDRKRINDDRERLIEQLQTERTRLAAILDQVPAAVVIAEAPSGRLVFGNRAFFTVTGWEFRPTELIEDYSSEWGVRHLDGSPVGREEMGLVRAVRHGEALSGQEFAIRRADGAWITLSGNTAPLRDERGTITGAVGVYTDITEIRRSEEAQRFLAESAQVLATSQDSAGTLEAVLRLAVPKLADWCVLELVGDDLSVRRVAVVHSDPRKQDLAAQIEHAKSGRGELFLVSDIVATRRPELVAQVTDEWIRERTRDAAHAALLGALGTRSVITVPLIARGALLGVFTQGVGDVRRYTEADFATAREFARRTAFAIDNARGYDAAQRAIADRNELLATVSHDLKNPISALLLNADLLQRALPDDAPARRNIDSIRRSARAMQRLITGLLEGARLEAGGLAIEPVACEVAPLIHDAIDEISSVAEQRSVRIEPGVEPGLPCIRCDRAQLGRVLVNLLDNAVKFSGEGGAVTMSATRHEGLVQLRITDTGEGISEADLEHVFERYWHGGGRSQGAGLGLYIAKGIVEAHGGTIDVQSRLGAGTEFVVSIPIA